VSEQAVPQAVSGRDVVPQAFAFTDMKPTVVALRVNASAVGDRPTQPARTTTSTIVMRCNPDRTTTPLTNDH
jgi:hypothetical protein